MDLPFYHYNSKRDIIQTAADPLSTVREKEVRESSLWAHERILFIISIIRIYNAMLTLSTSFVFTIATYLNIM